MPAESRRRSRRNPRLVMDEEQVRRLVRITDHLVVVLGAFLGDAEQGDVPDAGQVETAWQIVMLWETEGRAAALATLHD